VKSKDTQLLHYFARGFHWLAGNNPRAKSLLDVCRVADVWPELLVSKYHTYTEQRLLELVAARWTKPISELNLNFIDLCLRIHPAGDAIIQLIESTAPPKAASTINKLPKARAGEAGPSQCLAMQRANQSSKASEAEANQSNNKSSEAAKPAAWQCSMLINQSSEASMLTITNQSSKAEASEATLIETPPVNNLQSTGVKTIMADATTLPPDIMHKLQDALASIEQALLTKDPLIANHLRVSHGLIQSYPESVHLLTDAQIATIIDGLEVYTKTEIVKAIVKDTSTSKKRVKLGVEDM